MDYRSSLYLGWLRRERRERRGLGAFPRGKGVMMGNDSELLVVFFGVRMMGLMRLF